MPENPESTLTEAVTESLDALNLNNADSATARLARTYARAIDNAPDDTDTLSNLGPKLLAALAELGMTPKARAAIVRGEADAKPTTPRGRRIDELRARSHNRER